MPFYFAKILSLLSVYRICKRLKEKYLDRRISVLTASFHFYRFEYYPFDNKDKRSKINLDLITKFPQYSNKDLRFTRSTSDGL